jgi:hypothetical protein
MDEWEFVGRLESLHKNLEQAFVLVPAKKRLHVTFWVKLFSTRESLHYNDVATIGNHTQARVERTVLNYLEALREPVYDLIHAGGTISLFLTTSRSRRSVDLMKLFHLGSEEWLAVR